jgi:hypothetical protein
VSLIARHLEAEGTPTVCLASARDIIAAGNPPRAAFVDYPLGHTTGRPFEPEEQTAIVRAGLEALEGIKEPGTILDLGYSWPDPGWQRAEDDMDSGDEREPRGDQPVYQFEEDRLAAEAALAG